MIPSAVETNFDSDDEDGPAEKVRADTEKVSEDQFAGFLSAKQVKSAAGPLYFVNYSKAKGGNGLTPVERNELASKDAQAQTEEAALLHKLTQLKDTEKQLLSEPTNEDATVRLETEAANLEKLRKEVGEAHKVQVDEKYKKNVKRRVENMTAQWRKRRRLCMDFLASLEENSDGAISTKKCLAGDGQIEIDSDDAVAKATLSFAKQKRANPSKFKKRKIRSTPDNANGVPANPDFVAVRLDSQGQVERVFVE